MIQEHEVHSDIDRVEHELNRHRRDGGKIAVAIAVCAYLVFVAARTASASLIPADRTPATSQTCAPVPKNLIFAGTFKLDGSEKRFVITQPATGPAVAQIWSGNRCQATCSIADLDSLQDSVPIALDLQCRSGDLGALTAHVAVLWDHGARHETLVRLGSWLEGYEQAPLAVEIDHLQSTVAKRKGATFAYRAPAPIEH